MFISTHAPLAGRDCLPRLVSYVSSSISTHAPLAGRDSSTFYDKEGFMISTHAPLAGRDRRARGVLALRREFQPTRPLRGATHTVLQRTCSTTGFQPTRPLRGATFQTRAPFQEPIRFQPTRPLRGATKSFSTSALGSPYFNPRAPCGARQQKCTNHYAHFCDNRQISDAFAQNAACQGILLLFDAGKPCGFWVRTAQVISARLCFAL